MDILKKIRQFASAVNFLATALEMVLGLYDKSFKSPAKHHEPEQKHDYTQYEEVAE